MAKKAKNTDTVKNTNKAKSPTKLIFRITMAVLITILCVAIANQYFIGLDLKAQEAQLLAAISKEEAIGNSLKSRQENQDSPEFIEKIAREKLNMVKPNEIVFIDKNK